MLAAWSHHRSVLWQDIEGGAEYVLRAAGIDDFVHVPLQPVVEAVAGPGALRFVAGRELGAGVQARLDEENGQPVVKVRHGLPGEVARFAAAHEVGHLVLGHQDVRDDQIEAEADRFAAALLMPWRALHCMRNELGDDFEELAKVFGVTQTALALRIGETGEVSASVVIAPNNVRARSIGPIVLPSEDELRRLSRVSADELRAFGPGLRKAPLTDDVRRVVLMVDVDEEAG